MGSAKESLANSDPVSENSEVMHSVQWTPFIGQEFLVGQT